MEKQDLFVLTVDAETGETIERKLNTEELAEHKSIQKEALARKKQREARIVARASALAKLADLGLTKEEIDAL